MSKLQKFLNFLPNEFAKGEGSIINTLARAWAGEDEELLRQLQNTKASIFVRTAEGSYLDRLASNFGVSRPSSLGLLDSDFQQLIPNLSFKPKQLARSFYDTMDVFWGPLFSRANVTSTVTAPFAISPGDTFSLTVDGKSEQRVTVLIQDVAVPGAMTIQELLRILSRFEGITTQTIEVASSGLQRLNIRTNTPGPRGSLFFGVGGFTALGYDIDRKILITELEQRCTLYQVSPGELVIELPAVVPTLRRTLKGSHHFHADATLQGPVPPQNGVWAGSFLYSRGGVNPFVVTQTRAVLERALVKGSAVNELVVSDTTGFPPNGKLIFNFGRSAQEQPVSYIAVPNSKTILVDPGYSFGQTHVIGSAVNLLAPGQNTSYAPAIGGKDLAVFLTSPANARSVVQELLLTLAAAGVVVNFVILLPTYTYLRVNPYQD